MNQDRSAIHELQRIQQQTGKDQNDQQPEKTPKQMVDNAQRCRPYNLGNQMCIRDRDWGHPVRCAPLL